MIENYNLEKIKPELLNLNSCDLTNDFVAISTEVDEDGACYHSGLIICYQEEVYYFHYTSTEVKLEKLKLPITDKSIFIKHLNCVHPLEVEAFLGHCEKLITDGVSPIYGFIFNDSYYDTTSKDSFVLVNAQHDISTCVGFCIKVIRGSLFNNDEYLKINDWNINTLENTNPRLIRYFEHAINNYCTLHDLTATELISTDELKRITPAELLCSAFLVDLAIHKISIDLLIDRLIADIIELRSVA